MPTSFKLHAQFFIKAFKEPQKTLYNWEVLPVSKLNLVSKISGVLL